MPAWPMRTSPSSTRCSATWAGCRLSAPTSPPGHEARSTRSTGLSDSGRSLGIPTWHYGHEPPNPFSSLVAKYFRNAIREDVLLEVCRGGIVFLPGAAGTVQEIFQAACTNYYAAEDEVVPMVFVGEDYWTRTLPAWPLVDVLATGRAFAAQAHLVDDTRDALALLVEE